MLYEAHITLLEKLGQKQAEVSAELGAHTEVLPVLQDRLDRSQHEGAGASIRMDEQPKILEDIGKTVESVKMKLETTDTPTEVRSSDSLSTALAVTSGLAALVLSGMMLASTHELTMRAREMSSVVSKFKFQVIPKELAIAQPSRAQSSCLAKCPTPKENNGSDKLGSSGPEYSSRKDISKQCQDSQSTKWDRPWDQHKEPRRRSPLHGEAATCSGTLSPVTVSGGVRTSKRARLTSHHGCLQEFRRTNRFSSRKSDP